MTYPFTHPKQGEWYGRTGAICGYRGFMTRSSGPWFRTWMRVVQFSPYQLAFDFRIGTHNYP